MNIYMNVFDQFVKHKIKAKHYIRYADDFVFLSEDKYWLEEILFRVGEFLEERLRLTLHPDKISLRTLASGVDFLGWVHFSDHRVLRTTTKRRMLKRVEINKSLETLNSYLGLLKHGNSNKLKNALELAT
ncbi:MAG: reverse transcriptase domain-containing protein [bacterium]|nr:reverse transcriptase domain-containing protein [bacterium]